VGISELDDFGTFYRRTYAAAYRTALAVTASAALAEDATQEAYASAYRDRHGYRGDGPAEHWLQRIVVRKAIDQRRRRLSRAVGELPDGVAAEAGEPAGLTEQLALLDALDALQPRQRAAIVLRYFHDYPLRSVGRVLGTSEGGAAMLVRRGLSRLHELLAEGPDAAHTTPPGSARAEQGGAR
jgi:RNA polymerase sigma factor (sigma-70 family)